MSAEKSDAIVLRVIDFSETSCVVTMMTRDFGKITALAKGARRPKSPLEAALDVLAICRIVFLHKSSGAMDLLTEAKLERRFRSSTRELKRLYSAYYIVELLRTLTAERDPHPELFDVACKTICTIDDPGLKLENIDVELIRFELQMLKLLGHTPMLTKCVGCGKERTTQNQVSFGLNAGGLLCHQCRRGQANVVTVSPEGIELLLNLAGNDDGRLQPDGTSIRESTNEYEHRPQNVESSLPEVRRLLNKYITHLLGFTPRLHKFLTTFNN
jgi:DNA repair protein RecO (recombination protein O)